MKFTLATKALMVILLSLGCHSMAAQQETQEAKTSNAAGLQRGKDAIQKEDYATAISELKPLAEAGDSSAQYLMGMMYDTRLVGTIYDTWRGVLPDYVEAAKWFRKAAEQGDVGAQLRLAQMYGAGEGMPEDSVQAADWYRKAAVNGNAEAQWVLGVYYSGGQGVPKDPVQSADWNRKSAMQGYAPAESNLGRAYEKKKDYASAIFWYRKAADQEKVYSLYELGQMYRDGKGTAKDCVAAYALFTYASMSGEPINGNSDYPSTDSLAKCMTRAQVETGNALYVEMKQIGVLKALDSHSNK